MPQPKRGLGKGLGALIPTGPPASVSATGVTDHPAPWRSDENGTPPEISGAYLEEIAVKPVRA